MGKKDQPLYRVVADRVKHHLNDRQAFGAFTERDYSAWKAFVYALELYGLTDDRSRCFVLLRELVLSAQQREAVQVVFCQTIPAVLDWSHVIEIWPCIAAPSFIDLRAIERPIDWTCSMCGECGYGDIRREHRRCLGHNSEVH